MRTFLAFPIAVLAAASVVPGGSSPPEPLPAVERVVGTRIAGPDTVPTPDRALLGSKAFSARGCAACHTIGEGPGVGPDLAGVTRRRDPEWFLAMVTEPDSMLRDDPVARALHGRFSTTMPDLGVGPGEAEALWTFLAIATEPSSFAEAGRPGAGRDGTGCPLAAGETCPRAGAGTCPGAGRGGSPCTGVAGSTVGCGMGPGPGAGHGHGPGQGHHRAGPGPRGRG